ncbi:hypothetical protein GCM10007079_48650 [Nocardiopsis terrae]|nr:hypothetical protein GCM10007079_48650 [Nocardiopsis terrae]
MVTGIVMLSSPLLWPAAPASAEPVPVDPYANCPTLIYYTVPEASGGLFEIAETVLGDPVRASEIYEYTQGRVQPDGGALTSDQELRPGWHLIMPWDAAGEGVLEGQDPLCVAAVDAALAQGSTPPAPPAPPPKPEEEPSESPSPTAEPSEEASGGFFTPGSTRPNINPKYLAIGLSVLVTLTVFALFWQPILRGVSWPFRRIAALPWRVPKPPRFVRTLRRERRRRDASDVIAADRGAAKRANIAFAELLSAPAEVPARPVAVFTAPRMITVLVPANSTPPAASWRVLRPTVWRHSRSKSATSAVRFNTTTHTGLGLVTQGLLVSMGIIERPVGGEQVFVDFMRLKGLLTIGGHQRTAVEALEIAADGLRECGLGVRELERGEPLRAALRKDLTPPPGLEPAPMSGRSGLREIRRVVLLPRPLRSEDEDVLPLLPEDTLVLAQGESRYAHWHWTVTEDGVMDTGPLGVTVTLRSSRARERKRAVRLSGQRPRDSTVRDKARDQNERGRRGDPGRRDPRRAAGDHASRPRPGRPPQAAGQSGPAGRR